MKFDLTDLRLFVLVTDESSGRHAARQYLADFSGARYRKLEHELLPSYAQSLVDAIFQSNQGRTGA